MNKIFRLIAFLCLWSITSITCAESLSKTSFQYKGGKLGYLARDEVYSAWNPNDHLTVLKPGMKVMFFGSAECELRKGNGPVKTQGGLRFSQALDLTGIPPALDGKGQRWTPSGDTEQCNKSARSQLGDSFVHVNEDTANGGIGIYTFTGFDQLGHRSFFRQFTKSGKNGTGVNANIEGTFVALRFAWQKKDAIHPWGVDKQTNDHLKAEFKTVQSVVVASVDDTVVSPKNEPIQTKQQIIFAFINSECLRSDSTIKRKCALQYLFNTAVYRTGVTDWSKVSWFKSAGLFFDPAQGGIPVVHGPIGSNGQTSIDQKTGLELYTSLGESTHHDLFKDKSFHIQVSFQQLKNALKLVAASQLKRNPNKIDGVAMKATYGSRWDDPSQWVLSSINVAQEIYNASDKSNASIGGNIKNIEVGLVSP